MYWLSYFFIFWIYFINIIQTKVTDKHLSIVRLVDKSSITTSLANSDKNDEETFLASPIDNQNCRYET